MFKQGFDEVVTQVKHFNADVLVDSTKVDQERSLKDIIKQEFSVLPQ